MVDLTSEEVARVAALARLNLTDSEIQAMTAELHKILGYVEMLQNVNTEGVEPLTQVVHGETPTREDELTRDARFQKIFAS